MKLAIALSFLLGYCTLFVVATQKKKKGTQTKGKATATKKTPTPTPSPKTTATPAVKVTPTPSPTATVTPTPAATATVTPTPAASASPTTTTTPAQTGQAGGGMKILPFGGCEGVMVMPGIPLCSKTQPGDIILCEDCAKTPARDPEGVADPARFTHTAHATKNYSVDGKSQIACVECHHTDQPVSAMQPPYKTSQRAVAMVAATLNEANAAPVYACRACHTPVGMKPPLLEALPASSDPDSSDPKVTSKVAYHINCISCHQRANDFAGRTPRSKAPDTCASCHKR